tara:strand:+ start:406 stop:2478 length:2073 start_codon:yes stop_codon:yes gene_type:complete
MSEKEHLETSNEGIQDIKNLINSGNSIDAEVKIKKLLSKYPKSHELQNLLGVSLIVQKKLEEAEKIYLDLINFKKDFAEAYNNLGDIYFKQNKIEKAISYFEQALDNSPGLEQSLNNLAKIYTNYGNKFLLDGKIEDSINYYKKAIKIKPDFIDAHNNMGAALQNLDKFDEAVISFQNAIKINPNFEKSLNNLAASFVSQGRFEEAISFYDRAFKLNPDKTHYAINAKLLIPTIPQNNEEVKFWREKYISSFEDLNKHKYSIDDPQKMINPPTFNLSYSNFNNLNIMKKVSNFFRNSIPIINFIDNKKTSQNINNEKKEKLKIGFVSQFFTDHTIGKLYRGLFKEIDKNKFELIIFHFQKTKKGKIKDEIETYSNKIVYLNGKIDHQQNLIRKENLDIIFYPDIGMTSSTYFLAHARLAPIQVASWGHPETSGISTMDYFLSSSLMESRNANSFYTERLICLDRVFLNFIPPDAPTKKLYRKDFEISENKNLYSCPQTLFKIHPDFDKVLAKIIEKDRDAQIIMIETKHKAFVEKLKKRWSKNYPELSQKVKFIKNMSLQRFLSLIEISDVLLDPLYFGGGLSFAESMVVGTPTITMPNEFMRSNITAGAYKQMKIKNPPIVDNIDDYVELAIDLAKDKSRNFDYRNTLKNAAKLYLFNDKNAVRKFEKFLLEIHEASKKNSYLKSGLTI